VIAVESTGEEVLSFSEEHTPKWKGYARQSFVMSLEGNQVFLQLMIISLMD
jgi:hypothetical protein